MAASEGTPPSVAPTAGVSIPGRHFAVVMLLTELDLQCRLAQSLFARLESGRAGWLDAARPMPAGIRAALLLALFCLPQAACLPQHPLQETCDGEGVQRYMDSIKTSVLENWSTDSLVEIGLSRVTVRMRLGEDGGLHYAHVLQADDEAIGRSVLEALEATAPFGQMDRSTRCLAQHELTARFTLEAKSAE